MIKFEMERMHFGVGLALIILITASVTSAFIGMEWLDPWMVATVTAAIAPIISFANFLNGIFGEEYYQKLIAEN